MPVSSGKYPETGTVLGPGGLHARRVRNPCRTEVLAPRTSQTGRSRSCVVTGSPTLVTFELWNEPLYTVKPVVGVRQWCTEPLKTSVSSVVPRCTLRTRSGLG